ncbi:MAG: prolipoprotein diacylglyceryl transferase [Alphaproteobacteria bacterium]|nr:prolipoprotein diacylglyceryl transferase [Alphaproteobacteria bacterium]
MAAALPFPEIPSALFSVGPFELRWYALAYLGGILLGWWILRRITAKAGDPIGHPPLDDLINFGIIGIIIGGRLVYVLGYNLDYYLAHPLDALKVWQGGMAFHGGFLGMVAAIIFTARRHKVDMVKLGDLIAMVAPIGEFFGRLSNFINDELHGRVTDVPWAVVFPKGGYLPRHPSQIYEALLEGALLVVVLHIAYRMGARQRPGLLIGLFLAGYGMARIVVENFREPDAQLGFLFAEVTMGQLLSLPMVVIGLWLIRRGLSMKATP